MEGHNYILKIPLQEMALRRMAILLWNRLSHDSLPSLCNPEQSSQCSPRRQCSRERQELLNNLVQQVQEQSEKIFLPTSLREKLKHAIVPIVLEVKRWSDYHESLMTLTRTRKIFDQLCWTCLGTVDYRETAKFLIGLGHLDDISSYKLACVYCLERDIRKFWEKIPESYETPFITGSIFLRFRRRVTLVTFWTYWLKCDTDVLKKEYSDESNFSLFQYAFESAALSGNKVATEYFFQKLSFEEREASLTKTTQYILENENHREMGVIYPKPLPEDFPAEKVCDVVSYLFSKMKVEDQKEVFKKRPFATLVCFLDWPWQELFMKVAVHTWSFLSTFEYETLLSKIAFDNRERAIGHLFEDFFLQAPSSRRDGLYLKLFDIKTLSVFRPTSYINWFERLFYCSNAEGCIKIVLRYFTSSDRKWLITSRYGVDLCQRLINKEECSLLKLFIEECTLTDEAKKTLKDSLKNIPSSLQI